MTAFLLSLTAFALGAIVGSFINVLIYRLPRGESIVFPSSHCTSCRMPIRWHDNIPLISFFVLRGRCRSCNAAFSWRYPLVELIMGLLSLALLLKFQLSPPFGIYFIFAAALLAVVFIDFDHQIIPDAISLPGIVVGFALSFFNPCIDWQSSLIGILVGGGSLYAVAAGYYLITKREGMGGGDIKLLAMIGAFLGWQAIVFVVFVSALLGSLAGIVAMIKQRKGGKTVIPYGPFLSLAALLYLFYGEPIIFLVYTKLFHLSSPQI